MITSRSLWDTPKPLKRTGYRQYHHQCSSRGRTLLCIWDLCLRALIPTTRNSEGGSSFTESRMKREWRSGQRNGRSIGHLHRWRKSGLRFERRRSQRPSSLNSKRASLHPCRALSTPPPFPLHQPPLNLRSHAYSYARSRGWLAMHVLRFVGFLWWQCLSMYVCSRYISLYIYLWFNM